MAFRAAITSIDQSGYIRIPLRFHQFDSSKKIYCFKEHDTNQIFLSIVPLHACVESFRNDYSAELLCTLDSNKNALQLSEDVVKELNPTAQKPPFIVIVRKGYRYGKKEVLYLNQF